MTQHKEYRTLTREELDSLAGEPLPCPSMSSTSG